MLFFTLLTACSKDQPETCTTTVATTPQECIADYTERLSECMTEMMNYLQIQILS